MAGEYFAAAQLQRLGLMASITYGNAKRADVIAFSEFSDRVVVVEVKTTRQPEWTFSGRITTRSDKPWVFAYLPEKNEDPPRFFVLTQSDLYAILDPLDEEYCRKYKEKHGYEFGDRIWIVNIDKVLLKDHENKWGAIKEQLQT